MDELAQLVGCRVVATGGVNCSKGDHGTIVNVGEHGSTVEWDGKGKAVTTWLSIELEARI